MSGSTADNDAYVEQQWKDIGRRLDMFFTCDNPSDRPALRTLAAEIRECLNLENLARLESMRTCITDTTDTRLLSANASSSTTPTAPTESSLIYAVATALKGIPTTNSEHPYALTLALFGYLLTLFDSHADFMKHFHVPNTRDPCLLFAKHSNNIRIPVMDQKIWDVLLRLILQKTTSSTVRMRFTQMKRLLDRSRTLLSEDFLPLGSGWNMVAYMSMQRQPLVKNTNMWMEAILEHRELHKRSTQTLVSMREEMQALDDLEDWYSLCQRIITFTMSHTHGTHAPNNKETVRLCKKMKTMDLLL